MGETKGRRERSCGRVKQCKAARSYVRGKMWQRERLGQLRAAEAEKGRGEEETF